MFDKLNRLHNLGFTTWVTDTLKLYGNFERTCNISLDQFCSQSKFWIKSKLKRYAKQQYAKDWCEEMDAIGPDKKLRTYVLFKSDHKIEPYLRLPVPKYRFAIARFRCSSHNLPIELGRHTRPRKTDLKDRLCKSCSVLGDELHHVTACKKFDSLRKDLYDVVTKFKPNFHKLSDLNKFKCIMKSKEKAIIQCFGYFIYKSQLDLL